MVKACNGMHTDISTNMERFINSENLGKVLATKQKTQWRFVGFQNYCTTCPMVILRDVS